MAHSSVWTNDKFALAAHDLGIDLPHLIGHLEALWYASYDHCTRTGTLLPESVEVFARWCAEPGKLFSVCIARKILIRRRNRVQFPNYWQHIPEFVRRRIERKELQQGGRTTEAEQKSDKNCQTYNKSASDGGTTPLTPLTPLTPTLTEDKTTNMCSKKPAAPSFDFVRVWEQYPDKQGKKEAKRHFDASVKTDEDYANIQSAMTKYIDHVNRQRTSSQPSLNWQHAKTWFNNWRDWIDYEPPVVEKKPDMAFKEFTG